MLLSTVDQFPTSVNLVKIIPHSCSKEWVFHVSLDSINTRLVALTIIPGDALQIFREATTLQIVFNFLFISCYNYPF